MRKIFVAMLCLAVSLYAVPSRADNLLRWAARNDVLTLDPHAQAHTTTGAILQQAYEGLTRYDEQYRIEPALAVRWTAISPTQIRFELRRGVQFHDGSPFTADDVLFSFRRIRQPQATMQIFLAGVHEVRKVDDFTVDVLLDAPTPLLLRNLASARIMSRAWAEQHQATDTQDFKTGKESYATHHAMGTGPYKITDWVPDQKITMAVNRSWWDNSHRGNLTGIVYLPIKSDQTRVAALLSGDVDLVTDLPPQDVGRLKAAPGLKLLEGIEARTIFLALDLGSEELRGSDVKGRNPFKDRRVRQALSLAIDRDAIRRSTMRGMAIPAAVIVAPGVVGHSEDIDVAPRANLDRARALLAEAGYPQGFQLSLNCPNDRYVNDAEICQAVTAMWARIGVRAQLAMLPNSLHTQTLQRFEAPAYLLGWGPPTLDAQHTLQAIVRTRNGPADGSYNYSKVSDPALDALIDKAKTETDVDARTALLRDAIVRTRDEVLIIPLHHQVRPWAMRGSVDAVYNIVDQPQMRFFNLR
jgi:peptide/nickel transport system substrate-binding protein